MIAFLHGKLAEALPTRVVIDVNGVGYEVLVPISTFEKLPKLGADVKLLTYLQIRETEHVLFGFYTTEERDLFKLLVTHVSGVGPKMALAFLSGCSAEQFKNAIIQNDVAFLSRIKGVGKKTAERVVIELRDKVGISTSWSAPVSTSPLPSEDQQKFNDVLLALLSLGYKQPEALKALQNLPSDILPEELLREALKKL